MNDFIIGISYNECEYKSEMPCTSEQEALAIAVGAYLVGKNPLVFMNDMGFCQSLNILLSLIKIYNIKINIIIKTQENLEHHKYTSELCKVLKL